MIDEDRKDEVMFSIFDGNSWSEPENVLGGAYGAVTDLKIKEHNGVFYILFASFSTFSRRNSSNLSSSMEVLILAISSL